MYIFVRESGLGPWHYALASEILPVCGCQCVSPVKPKKLGDSLCRCPCHLTGKRLSFTLCMKLPVTRWDAAKIKLTGRAMAVCHDCHVKACKPRNFEKLIEKVRSGAHHLGRITFTRFAVLDGDRVIALARSGSQVSDLPQGWLGQGLAYVPEDTQLDKLLPPFDYELVKFI